MKPLSFLFALLVCLNGHGQIEEDCRNIMRKVDSAIRKNDYSRALAELQAYKICNPAKTREADNKIVTVFNLIKAQRDSAETARIRADIQTRIARAQRAKAMTAQATAEHQTYLAQLAAFSSSLMVLNTQNPTFAFRLACIAYEKNPSRENASILHSIISDTTNRLFDFNFDCSQVDSYAVSDETNSLYLANRAGIVEFGTNGRYKKSIRFPGHNTKAVEISPTGSYTVRLDSPSTLFLYRNPDTSSRSIDLAYYVRDLRWSHDGRHIFLRSPEGVLHVLDTNLKVVYKFVDKGMWTFDMSADLRQIATSDLRRVVIRDTADSGKKDTIPESEVDYLACGPNGKLVYTAHNNDRAIKVWTLKDHRPFAYIFGSHTANIRSINFIPRVSNSPSSADTIISSADDGVCFLWSGDGGIISSMRAAPKSIFGLFQAVLSSEGKRALTTFADDGYFWDLRKNPFGTLISKGFAIDRSGSVVVQSGAHTFLTRANHKMELPNAPDDRLLRVSSVDGRDRYLITNLNEVSLLDMSTGEQRVLAKRGGNHYIESNVSPAGDILLRNDTTWYYFGNDGRLLKKLSHNWVFDACIDPRTKYIASYFSNKLSLMNMYSGATTGTWTIDIDMNARSPIGMQYSPLGDHLLIWTDKEAILFDTLWHTIKNYNIGSIENASFSTTGDSIYFFTESGVQILYSLSGLRKSKLIYDLSEADRLKYNVPGELKEVIDSRNWWRYQECIEYYSLDHLSTGDRADLDVLNYLTSQSRRFFQKTKNYYSALDGRIKWFDHIVENARINRRTELVKILSKLAAGLRREQQTLTVVFASK